MKKLLYKIGNYLLNKEWILKIVMKFLSEEKQKKIYIAKIKSELSFFGFDTSDMSEEDIDNGVKELCTLIRQTGLSSNDVVKFSQALALASNS